MRGGVPLQSRHPLAATKGDTGWRLEDWEWSKGGPRSAQALWEAVACDARQWESKFLHPNRSDAPHINMFSARSVFHSAFAISQFFFFFSFYGCSNPLVFLPSAPSRLFFLIFLIHLPSFSTSIHPAFLCNATFNVQLSTANNFISRFSLSGPSFFTSFEPTPIRLPT